MLICIKIALIDLDNRGVLVVQWLIHVLLAGWVGGVGGRFLNKQLSDFTSFACEKSPSK
jgi:hypothetical protein